MHTTQDAIDAQERALETRTPEQEEKEEQLKREAARYTGVIATTGYLQVIDGPKPPGLDWEEE